MKNKGVFLQKFLFLVKNDYKEQKMASNNCVDNYLLVCYRIG